MGQRAATGLAFASAAIIAVLTLVVLGHMAVLAENTKSLTYRQSEDAAADHAMVVVEPTVAVGDTLLIDHDRVALAFGDVFDRYDFLAINARDLDTVPNGQREATYISVRNQPIQECCRDDLGMTAASDRIALVWVLYYADGQQPQAQQDNGLLGGPVTIANRYLEAYLAAAANQPYQERIERTPAGAFAAHDWFATTEALLGLAALSTGVAAAVMARRAAVAPTNASSATERFIALAERSRAMLHSHLRLTIVSVPTLILLATFGLEAVDNGVFAAPRGIPGASAWLTMLLSLGLLALWVLWAYGLWRVIRALRRQPPTPEF